MTVSPKQRFDSAVKRLRTCGITATQLLPSWWDPSMLKSEAADALVQEVLGDLAAMTGVSSVALFEPHADLILPAVPGAYFRKTAAQTRPLPQLSVAREFAGYATRALRDLERTAESVTAAEFHATLHGAGADSLPRLLDACWKHGIPVLPLAKIGKQGFKGVALRYGSAPAIVLSGEETSPGELLFTIAHELGHVMLDHVANDAAIVDELLDGSDTDEREVAADEFGVEVLQGKRHEAPERVLQGGIAEMVRTAGVVAGKDGIHAGHLARSWFREYRRHHPRAHFAPFIAQAKPLDVGAPAMPLVRAHFFRELDGWDISVGDRARLAAFVGRSA